MAGRQGLAQRNFLAYARGMESSADQAALRYPRRPRSSPARGMITCSRSWRARSIAVTAERRPLCACRIRCRWSASATSSEAAKKSPYYERQGSARPRAAPPAGAGQAHRASPVAPQAVMQRYPSTDQSMPARYARAIAMFRKGDIQNALPIIDSLTGGTAREPLFLGAEGPGPAGERPRRRGRRSRCRRR